MKGTRTYSIAAYQQKEIKRIIVCERENRDKLLWSSIPSFAPPPCLLLLCTILTRRYDITWPNKERVIFSTEWYHYYITHRVSQNRVKNFIQISNEQLVSIRTLTNSLTTQSFDIYIITTLIVLHFYEIRFQSQLNSQITCHIWVSCMPIVRLVEKKSKKWKCLDFTSKCTAERSVLGYH